MKTKLAALAALLLFLLGCASSPQREPFRMRVMTYNIHHGEGIDGKFDLQRIAKLISENKADLVALQEVDFQTKRTGRRDIASELGALTGMTNVFGPNIDFEGGQYGNAILSKFPIVNATNHHLPQISPNEQRGMLQATFRLPNGALTFCSIHLDHRRPEADRLAGVARLHELLANVPTPQIIAGDFNARPESQTYQNMSPGKIYRDAWKDVGAGEGHTIPSQKPNARIDYIWYRGGRLIPTAAKVIPSEASDHLPLLIEFIEQDEK